MVHGVRAFQVVETDSSFCKAGPSQFNHPTERNNMEPQRPVQYQQPYPTVESCMTNMNSNSMFQQSDCDIMVMQSSPASNFCSVKSSPGYMDADVQFNYPDLTSPMLYHQGSVEPVNSEASPAAGPAVGVSKIERQYSINTVMEVIASHNINETSSMFSGSNSNNQYQQPTPCFSQPININRQPVENTNHFTFPDSIIIDNPEKHVYQNVSVPPASDIRERNQYGCSPAYSNVSYSPGGVPFTRYQDCSAVPSSPGFGNNNQSMVPLGSSNKSINSFPCQASEDVLSPSRTASSPFNWDPSQMSHTSPAQPGTSGYNDDVFSYETPAPHFQPSQSCPNFSFVSQEVVMQEYGARVVKGFNQNQSVAFPQPAPSHVASTSNVGTINFADLPASPTSIELEEIDIPTFNEELSHDMNVLTEQQRVDHRRIRNNLACKASRQRRKRRKEEKQVLAEYLEDQNNELKEQIRKMELERNSLTENVRRHMSLS